ncbi:endolytic transglycosylase MltG [Candidatus Parcubacteria bacterium]|nr:endolytic transglycosylase MltG [Candidatus Parcubacteria bacterium]
MKKIIFLIFTIVVAGGYFYYWQGIYSPMSRDESALSFVVASGERVDVIADNLYGFGLIKNKNIFKIYIWQKELGGSLQAGTYLLNTKMSIVDIAMRLSTGQTENREIIIKIIEGWTIEDIDKYLSNLNIISSQEFSSLANQKTASWPFEFVKPEALAGIPINQPLEGYLFPDTYRMYNDARAEDVIEKLINTFASRLTGEMINEINKQGKTIHEIITTASIIEKEVSLDKDRKIVSGILNKRLDIGMRLEVDSSINYITGKNDPAARYSDLEIDSPYNTYKYYGLPPGPICNPGLSSINAAINPVDSDYLFYLNRQDTKTKETIFSKTYDEHLRNKNKYLK